MSLGVLNPSKNWEKLFGLHLPSFLPLSQMMNPMASREDITGGRD